MQTEQSPERFVFLYFIVFLFVILAASVIWFFSGRYTAQLIQTIEDNTSIECLPVSIDYSILTGRMVLEKPELRISPGVTLKSEEINFSVNWTSLWTNDLQLHDINVKQPHISINSQLLGRRGVMRDLRSFLSSVGKFDFEDGQLTINQSASNSRKDLLTLPFQSLALSTQSFDRYQLEIIGSNNQWHAEGVVYPDDLKVNGQISLTNVPLQAVYRYGFLQCDRCEWNGGVNADLSVEWSKQSGLELEGTAMVEEGSLQDKNNGVSMGWEQVIAEDFHYYRKSGSVKTLSIHGGRLEFSAEDYLAQIHETFQVNLKDQFERIVFDGAIHHGGDNVRVQSVHAVVDFERSVDAFLYQAAGSWQGKVPFTLEGRLDAQTLGNSRFSLATQNINFAQLDSFYQTVQQFDLAGSQANLFMTSKGHRIAEGMLVFNQFGSQKAPVVEDFSKLKAVLTDVQGKVQVRVEAGVWSGQFLSSLKESLAQSFQSAVLGVPDYLRKVVNSKPLQFQIEHKRHQSKLSKASKSELENWAVVLKQRPLLGLAVYAPAQVQGAVHQYLISQGVDKRRVIPVSGAGADHPNQIRLKVLFP